MVPARLTVMLAVRLTGTVPATLLGTVTGMTGEACRDAPWDGDVEPRHHGNGTFSGMLAAVIAGTLTGRIAGTLTGRIAGTLTGGWDAQTAG